MLALKTQEQLPLSLAELARVRIVQYTKCMSEIRKGHRISRFACKSPASAFLAVRLSIYKEGVIAVCRFCCHLDSTKDELPL